MADNVYRKNNKNKVIIEVPENIINIRTFILSDNKMYFFMTPLDFGKIYALIMSIYKSYNIHIHVNVNNYSKEVNLNSKDFSKYLYVTVIDDKLYYLLIININEFEV